MTERPGYGPDRLVRGLSLPRRVGYLLAGFGGLATAALVGTLWATEPGTLPAHTRIAFTAVIVIGLTWAGLAGRALTRGPLFAVDRVIAAWLALTFSVLIAVGTVSIAVPRAGAAVIFVCGGVGGALTVTAGLTLARARARHRTLLARRDELEHGKSGPPAR